MYAWRGHIGLIKPTHRGKSFAFWYNHAPEGVEIVPTFIGFRRGDRESFGSAFEPAERLADDLKAVGCTIIAVSGTPPFLLKGLDFEREWGDRGIPANRPSGGDAHGGSRHRPAGAGRSARGHCHLLQ